MTRKINSLNIAPLIDIMLVIFVVLMVVGRFDDEIVNTSENIISDLNSTLTSKIAQISNLNSVLSAKITEIDELNQKYKTLSTKQSDRKNPSEDIAKLKEENKKLKEENKSKVELVIHCQGLDEYVINGKTLTLNDVDFLQNLFRFKSLRYTWVKDNIGEKSLSLLKNRLGFETVN